MASSNERNRYWQPDNFETYIQDFRTDIDQAEIDAINLVVKLRAVADDLQLICDRCRYGRLGTTGLKTASGFISAAGGLCILCSTGPIMPLVTAGAFGLALGSLGDYGIAKLEYYLCSEKFSELIKMVEMNNDLLKRIQERVDQACSLDEQTLQALLLAAERLIEPDHPLSRFFQMLRAIMASLKMDTTTEVPSIFEILRQVEGLGGHLMSFYKDDISVKDAKSGGFQKFGGLLLILTGVLSAYSSGQELVELIRTKKSESVEMLKAKADEIETKLRLRELLRD
jgi:hypothetical protein